MPDRKQDRSPGRPEFEVAYYTKELGQPLQRQMLQKQLARFSSGNAGATRDTQPVQPTQDPQPTDVTGA
jgi:hypothetical protein